MSTPKIKVYRLDKGYNPDKDNDIQSRLNSEILPFVKKNQKSTDAYYLTGVSDEIIEYNPKKISGVQYIELTLSKETNVLSASLSVEEWEKIIKEGYYRCRVVQLVKVDDNNENIYEELCKEKNESSLLNEIQLVRNGNESNKSYFTLDDFRYAHPFIFFNREDFENNFYKIEYSNDDEMLTVKVNVNEQLNDDEKIILDNSIKYYIQCYTIPEQSTSYYLKNYPLYDGKNHFYTPFIFLSEKIPLTIKKQEGVGYYSEAIEITDNYILIGTGKPNIICNGNVLSKENYELQYSFSDNKREVFVRIFDDFFELEENKGAEYCFVLNKHVDLVSKESYSINSDTGLVTFNENIDGIDSKNISIYYRKKEQRSKTFVSEHLNWSFGHLRNNPDIFFGEQIYTGDEVVDANTGTALYNGLKPIYLNNNEYQIDYFRGTVTFHNQEKTVYKSEVLLKEDLINRNENQAETFVRANYSYYPEIHGVYQQKLNLVDSNDGYIYKPIEDSRYDSKNKRWIMKSDEYQPLFFDEFIDGVKVCSQYMSTYPNYDKLENKGVNIIDKNTTNIKFTLPLIESKFVLLNNNGSITFLKENIEVETFEFVVNNEEISLNGTNLIKGMETKINGEIIELNVIYLYHEKEKKSFSIQMISAEYMKQNIEGEEWVINILIPILKI